MKEKLSRAAEILGRCRLLKGFSFEETAFWAEKFSCVFASYQKDDVVFREEDKAEGMAIVVSGEFFAGKTTGSGANTLTNVYRAGSLLGIPEICTTRATWARSCRCAAAGELLWFDPRPLMEAEDDEAALRANLHFRANLESVLANHAVKLFYRTEVISTHPLRERVLLFLRMMRERYGGEETGCVRLHMNRTQLAEYLAVDRSTLSRELNRMESDGLLRLGDSYTYYLLEGKKRA